MRRRDFIKGATGLAAHVLLPTIGCSPDVYPAPDGPFRHGVASGDPLPDAVILWTRVTRDDEGVTPIEVSWEIAKDESFATIVGHGTFTTDANRDYTVKVDATGLEPATTYFYRFHGLGVTSLVGRTKTAPRNAKQLRFAVVSCSNYAWGYFHVYRAIAERSDVDAVIHVGDYIYEYGDDEYGDERHMVPKHECRTLDDYRRRYAHYRLDFDLSDAHRQHPFITTWDDHEVVDNAWGGWPEPERRRAAFQAYAEWMPIRGDLADGKIWRALRYGDLADLFILDTRHWGKEPQAGDDDPIRYAAGRQLLGVDQEAWFFDQLRTSTAEWKVVCQQVLMSPLPQYLNTDLWDGYPSARDRFYDVIEHGPVKNVVVLSGDFHASFACDLPRRPLDPGGYDPETGRGSLAVEILTPAVASEFPSRPKLEGEVLVENNWMKHVDLGRHGYVLLDLYPDRAHASFLYVKDVESRDGQNAVFAKGVATRSGENFLRDAGLPVDPPQEIL